MEGKVFYITKDKLKELKKEYEDLVSLERTRAEGKEVPRVLESEDLNPEFISFQEDAEFLRSKIDHIKDVLDHHHIIKNPPKQEQVFVNLGATVIVEVGGRQDKFLVVGTVEANPTMGKISNESPVGKALIGRKIGDEVAIMSPLKKTYKIKGIKYELS